MQLSQRKYVFDLFVLAEIGKLGAKSCSTPMIPNIHLVEEDTTSFQDPERQRRLVGKLNYLRVTRPDIAYGVSVLSQFMFAPTNKHWATLEQILCYLKGAPELGVLYRNNEHACIDCFVDANRVGSKTDRRSTTGY